VTDSSFYFSSSPPVSSFREVYFGTFFRNPSSSRWVTDSPFYFVSFFSIFTYFYPVLSSSISSGRFTPAVRSSGLLLLFLLFRYFYFSNLYSSRFVLSLIRSSFVCLQIQLIVSRRLSNWPDWPDVNPFECFSSHKIL
jgi:hypothetical protein